MVLAAIGSGERTFTNIARAAGGIAHSTLTRAADLLINKGVVAGELPVSLSPSKERRYRITDSYLRFWLAFLGPHLAEVDRMRSDLTLARIERSWTGWRGRAAEPLVREALARILPARDIPAAPVIGSYWTRSNDVELDIVGADREPVAKQLLFLGSVKWLETGSSTTTTWWRSSATGTGSPPARSRSSPSPARERPRRTWTPPSPPLT